MSRETLARIKEAKMIALKIQTLWFNPVIERKYINSKVYI